MLVKELIFWQRLIRIFKNLYSYKSRIADIRYNMMVKEADRLAGKLDNVNK